MKLIYHTQEVKLKDLNNRGAGILYSNRFYVERKFNAYVTIFILYYKDQAELHYSWDDDSTDQSKLFYNRFRNSENTIYSEMCAAIGELGLSITKHSTYFNPSGGKLFSLDFEIAKILAQNFCTIYEKYLLSEFDPNNYLDILKRESIVGLSRIVGSKTYSPKERYLYFMVDVFCRLNNISSHNFYISALGEEYYIMTNKITKNSNKTIKEYKPLNDFITLFDQ